MKRTNTLMKNQDLVKDYHFYKAKLIEQYEEKKHQFEAREVLTLANENERLKTDNKKLKIDAFRIQQALKKKGIIP